MSIADIDNKLNEVVKQGKMLEALTEFYDENCTFQEGNDTPRVGRQTQHDHLSNFFSTLKGFNGATLHNQGVGDDTTLTEWTFDMVGPDGPIVWNEILRRQWKNGKVVSERFYTA
jgi:hypothetical protein